jgi:hypothetical protein
MKFNISATNFTFKGDLVHLNDAQKTQKNSKTSTKAEIIRLNTTNDLLEWVDTALSQLTQPADIKTKQKISGETFKQLEYTLTHDIGKVIKDARNKGKENKLWEVFDKSFEIIGNLDKRGMDCEELEAFMLGLMEKLETGELFEYTDIDCGKVFNLGDIANLNDINLDELFKSEPAFPDEYPRFRFDINADNLDESRIANNVELLLREIKKRFKFQSPGKKDE